MCFQNNPRPREVNCDRGRCGDRETYADREKMASEGQEIRISIHMGLTSMRSFNPDLLSTYYAPGLALST